MNTVSRTFGQHFIRVILALGFLALPTTGFAGVWLYGVIAGAWIAYEGVDTSQRYWLLGLLVMIELGYGIGLGTLSLAYLVTVLLVRLVGRVVAWVPLSLAWGWGGVLWVQAWIFAWASGMVMAALSTTIGALAYDYTHLMVRLEALIRIRILVEYAFVALMVLLILRCVDLVWRRPI